MPRDGRLLHQGEASMARREGTEENRDGEQGRGFTVKSMQSESRMKIHGHRATVNHRLLSALFVIISIFLSIDSAVSWVTKGKLLHVQFFSLSLRFLFFLLCALGSCGSLVRGPGLAVEFRKLTCLFPICGYFSRSGLQCLHCVQL